VGLLSAVAASELSRSYRHRAKREHGLPSVSVLHTGSVTFVQRVDGALRLNIHAHTLAIDGVYIRGEQTSALQFLPLAEPTEQDVEQLAERTAARIERVLRKAGRYLDAQADPSAEPDALALTDPALSPCYQAAAGGQQLFGDGAGKPALRLVLGPATDRPSAPKLCAVVRGVNIHASAAVPGTDRPRIERLCRYAARPPLSQERLEQLPDGRLRLQLKKTWADGTTAFVLRPLDFIARVVAAIPPPLFHMTRFHGVLSSHSTLRPLVIPKPAPLVQIAPQQLPLFPQPTSTTPACDSEPPAPRHQGRHPWVQLLRHVFAADVTACAHCKGRMRLRVLCTTPSAIARAMARAGLAPQPPPRPSAPRVHPTQLRLALS
jgi:Putative transposase